MSQLSIARVTLLALMAGCTPPPSQESTPSTARASPELAARAEAWEAMFDARDIDGLVELYTEDARFMPPNGEMARGRGAIREDIQSLVDSGLQGSLETMEAMVAGDLGYRVGTYTLSAPDGSVADKGKYIEIWRLVAGEWKITNDIYNSDLPAPGPAGPLVVTSHEVGDPAVWLAAWQGNDRRRQQFASHGAPVVRIFQDPESPSSTGLLIGVTDMDAFQSFVASDEGDRAKAEDTVIDETVRVLVEVE